MHKLLSDRRGPLQDVLVRRLADLGTLSSADVALLLGTGSRLNHVASRSELIRDGEDMSAFFLLEGWLCRQRVFPDGRRQVISFYLPGDVIGSIVDPSPRPSPCSLVALTPVVVADATPVRRALADDRESKHRGLADAGRRAEYLDQCSLMNHIARLGRQTAYERMTHLLLEIRGRLDAVGQVTRNSFTMPLTQEVLADALGLSIVHVNRTLQQLRRDELLELRGPSVVLKDYEALVAIADFRPLY
jgi:CRP-like cAMP-binding protein